MEFPIALDQHGNTPIYRQLYDEMRQAILKGRLTAGTRVPSTRALASSLGVARSTVTQSYEQLISEGYLQTLAGSGTRVSERLPEECLLLNKQPKPKAAAAKSPKVKTPPAKQPQLSHYGLRLTELVREPAHEKALFNFTYCRPAVDRFPRETWRRLLMRHCRGTEATSFDYASDGCGYQPLRVALAQYLAQSRAVQCTAEQIIIVNGSQQALQLIAQVLVNRDDRVALEEPGYHGARQVLHAQGAQLLPIRVDAEGLAVHELPRTGVKLAYVTPSHQFPTGAELTLPRRLALLQWAQAAGAYVIEDDYDSEYRYGSRPLPALQGLDESESVLYVGTFSKIMFPALRVGYLVVPSALVPVFERAKWLTDRHTPMLEQRALTDFLNEGHLERHLRQMRKLYDQRRQTLVRALHKHFGERVTIMGASSGMHLMVKLETALSETTVMQRAAAVSVGINGAHIYYLGQAPGNEFVMGYTTLSERQIQEAVRRLAQALIE